MLIPMLSVHISFTGGSSMPKHKRRLVRNEEGVLVDEVAIRQRQSEAARKAEKEKAAKVQARRRKGKATCPNYKSMPEAEYVLVRRNNWYATPRDEDIEDRGFWNEEQWGIFREPLKNPCRPMHPIDFDHLRSKTYFDEAVSVVEKLGLMGLATIQCNYNPGLIKQFYATLVILPNAQKSMKWMTGEHECTSDFSLLEIRVSTTNNYKHLVVTSAMTQSHGQTRPTRPHIRRRVQAVVTLFWPVVVVDQ
jgi:hypothetical protein